MIILHMTKLNLYILSSKIPKEGSYCASLSITLTYGKKRQKLLYRSISRRMVCVAVWNVLLEKLVRLSKFIND